MPTAVTGIVNGITGFGNAQAKSTYTSVSNSAGPVAPSGSKIGARCTTDSNCMSGLSCVATICVPEPKALSSSLSSQAS